MTGLDKAIETLTRSGVADVCGLETPEAVTNWKGRDGLVPAKHCQKIQIACRKLGVEITLHELNRKFFIDEKAA